MKKIFFGVKRVGVNSKGVNTSGRIISLIWLSVVSFFNISASFAAVKFDVIPDLPEPLSAQASTVSTTGSETLGLASNIGAEPNLVSVIFSLLFVILLIYATGIIYTKLNKLGFKTMKKQMGEVNPSKVSVVSTTPLGANKTLHVVELDGKRMLIGASQNSIHLIKDLGSYSDKEIEKLEYSNIEIPNIRIPKIEIPKIEFPNIGFTKAETQSNQESAAEDEFGEENKREVSFEENSQEESAINNLFNTDINNSDNSEYDGDLDVISKKTIEEHQVDPDEYALYKKYL